VSVVGNKIRSDADREYLSAKIPAEDLLGFISYSDEVISADQKGGSPFETDSLLSEEIKEIKERIDNNEETI
jgi:CO dehydrogenase maturation factor